MKQPAGLTLCLSLLCTVACRVPVTPYPNAALLISPAALAQRLAEPGLRIIDARSRAEYVAGHLPGAISLPVEALRVAATQRRKPVTELALALGQLGLTRKSKMVVYDDPWKSQGAAGYVFWTLETLGCGQLALLNGGWPRWLAEQQRVTTNELLLAHQAFDATPETQPILNQEQIKQRLGRPAFALVDVRSDEEFSGWPAPGQKRGGHLPGARHWPWQWGLTVDGTLASAAVLKALWAARELTTETKVALYSNESMQAGFVYFVLRLLGFPRAALYEGGMNEWSAADAMTFPLKHAPRYESIVSAAWVKAVQDFHTPGTNKPRPASYRNNRYVILETSWGALAATKEYRQGHLPGALHLDTDEFENGYPRWHLKPVAELQRVIGRFGITPETTVIVYSHKTIAAARSWWVLSYAGVQDVRLLNGGYAAWQQAGYVGETAVPEAQAVSFAAPARDPWLATTDYVHAHLQQGTLWLADARSLTEYQGKVSGYDYLARRGRIPGALHIGDADDEAHLYQDHDGTLRSYSEIETRWAQLGLKLSPVGQTFEREVIFYCGSGWRSSLTFLYAYLLGYANIRNYSDGWSAWSTTYEQDASEKGLTPGWRQSASANPIASDRP